MQNNKLFVRNLSYSTTDGELNSLFAGYGNVLSAKMAVERETGRPRGFGFVEMGDHESAQDAIRGLDNREVNGRTMYVAVSEQRERKMNTTYGS